MQQKGLCQLFSTDQKGFLYFFLTPKLKKRNELFQNDLFQLETDKDTYFYLDRRRRISLC